MAAAVVAVNSNNWFIYAVEAMGIGEATADAALLNNEFSRDLVFRRGNGGDTSLGAAGDAGATEKW